MLEDRRKAIEKNLWGCRRINSFFYNAPKVLTCSNEQQGNYQEDRFKLPSSAFSYYVYVSEIFKEKYLLSKYSIPLKLQIETSMLRN